MTAMASTTDGVRTRMPELPQYPLARILVTWAAAALPMAALAWLVAPWASLTVSSTLVVPSGYGPAGDCVIVSDREFPANVYPWLRLREAGIDVRHRKSPGSQRR